MKMKIILENWRKLLEGDVIQGPWGQGAEISPGEEEGHEEFEGGGPMEAEVPRNAMIANEIDSTIQSHMTKKYGSPEDWTLDQLNAIDQISDLLDVIFPSGE